LNHTSRFVPHLLCTIGRLLHARYRIYIVLITLLTPDLFNKKPVFSSFYPISCTLPWPLYSFQGWRNTLSGPVHILYKLSSDTGIPFLNNGTLILLFSLPVPTTLLSLDYSPSILCMRYISIQIVPPAVVARSMQGLGMQIPGMRRVACWGRGRVA